MKYEVAGVAAALLALNCTQVTWTSDLLSLVLWCLCWGAAVGFVIAGMVV